RVLAKRRGIVDRPGIDRQLRGAVGGDPRASIEAQREDLPLNKVREEILPLQRFPIAAIDISSRDRLPHAVVIGVDWEDEGTGIANGTSSIGYGTFIRIPAIVRALLAEIDLFPCILSNI